MKIGIVGSRSFPDLPLVTTIIDHLPPDTTILSGGAIGVDQAAINAARRRGLFTQEFLPDTTGCTKGFEFTKAYYARNQQIVDAADELIAFTEKDSGGTWDTIRRARRKGIPVHIYRPTTRTPLVRPPKQIGKGPFHLKRVGFGSAALHMKKYMEGVPWADFLNSKRDDPATCAATMLPDFLTFFREQHFGVIHAITQAPKSVRNLPRLHPMDQVCQAVATALDVPYVEMFAPWHKPHRGVCLTVPPLDILPIAQTYHGKVVFILDDVSTTNLTLKTACTALSQQGIHCHAVCYVRY